jgi:hypothetical protein
MNGVELIAAERERQQRVEEFDFTHDDQHDLGQLIGAAMTYAGHALEIVTDNEISGADATEWWPWEDYQLKPSPDPIRNLTKAGALIAAEIDRLQRLEVKP